MKKKVFFATTAVVALTMCAFAFAACDFGNTDSSSHKHDWQIKWTVEGDYHWHACNGCEEKDSYARHDFTNGDCVCGTEMPIMGTKGIVYGTNGDHAYVKGYGGAAATATEMVIASEYKGKPVTKIAEGAFRYCRSLTAITIPDSVTSIGSAAFYQCESLTSVAIPDGVTGIGDDTFRGCRSLTSVTIPNGVTNLGGFAFENCSSLNSLILPVDLTRIGEYAFGNCGSLTSLSIPDGVTSIGDGAFENCSFESATIPASACKDIKNPALKTVTITSGDRIASDAFNGCNSLRSVTLSDSVIWIGSYAFKDCPIETATIPAWACSNVKNAELKSVTVTSGDKIRSSQFYGCSKLTKIKLPNGITEIGEWAFKNTAYYDDETNWEGKALYIGEYLIEVKPDISGSYQVKRGTKAIACQAFIDCNLLTSVTLENGMRSIGHSAFRNCSSLTSVTIPDGVRSVGGYAFEDCESLLSLVLPDSVRSVGDYAFNNAASLTSISISRGLTNIGRFVFGHCRSLTEVTIPDRVTSIEIGAFAYCSSLMSVTIPDSVTRIDYYAFAHCASLEKFYYKGSAGDWGKILIGLPNDGLTSATRYDYSETEPALNEEGTAYDGDYWHYGDDGVTVVEWKKEN